MKKPMQPRSASQSPAQNTAPEAGWADIHLQPGDEPLLTYRSGMAVYEESLTKNRFVGRGWSGSGFVRFYNIWDCRLDPADHPAPQAFWLEIDGQLLASDWQWGGFEKRRAPGGPLHGTVTLKHRVRPVTVKYYAWTRGNGLWSPFEFQTVRATAHSSYAITETIKTLGVARKLTRLSYDFRDVIKALSTMHGYKEVFYDPRTYSYVELHPDPNMTYFRPKFMPNLQSDLFDEVHVFSLTESGAKGLITQVVMNKMQDTKNEGTRELMLADFQGWVSDGMQLRTSYGPITDVDIIEHVSIWIKRFPIEKENEKSVVV